MDLELNFELWYPSRVIGLIMMLAVSPGSSAEPPAYAAVRAEAVRPRDGLGNVLSKLNHGDSVKIAYLGGSITAAPGWRVKTREWFSREYPQANV